MTLRFALLILSFFASTAFAGATAIVTTPHTVHQHLISIQQVMMLLERAGYSNVTKIALRHGYYHVNGVNIHGQKIQMRVDPISGAITSVHQRH